MRSRFFGHKPKALIFFILSALLIFSPLMNLFAPEPAFAATCTDTSRQYCYVVKIYANQYAANIGNTATEIEYKTLTVSSNSNVFTYKNDQNTSVTGHTVNVSVNFQLMNDDKTLDTYTQSSGQNNLGPTRVEFYASDGVTLLHSETFQNTSSGGNRTIAISGTTSGNGNANGAAGDGSMGGGQETYTCGNSAGGLGWIACVVIDQAANLLSTLYQNFVEPVLVINPSFLDANNGAHEAWATFRDIANVLFVILMLVVILSQVTGVGIDNYGIKKILPRLIVTAILVNLSYYICQGAVDISNIIGQSMGSFLSGIGGELNVPAAFTEASGGAQAGATGLLAAAVTGGAIWVVAHGILGSIIIILTAVIGALVALLFMFLLLAGRQAIVIILVAISPLAFVAYALPNTKNLFDRWRRLATSMLLLYPICGLVIGGGALASKIIMRAGGVSTQTASIFASPASILTQFAAANGDVGQLLLLITAVIAELAPYFLIPSLVRNAYRATGQLGARLNGLSARFSRGTTQGLRNTGLAQRGMQRSQAGVQIRRARSAYRRANRIANRYDRNRARHEANIDARDTALDGENGLTAGLRYAATHPILNARAARSERLQARAAEQNQTALAYEEARQKRATMSSGEQRAGMAAQQEISTQQQRVKNADYADANFTNAVIAQAQIEHDASRDRQLNYNNTRYAEGKRNANELANENEFYNTRQYAQSNFVEGKRQEARLGREGERARAGLYNTAGYVDSRRNQQQAVISGEITKMYADQYSRMGTGELLSQFESIVKASSGTQNHAEQFTAAFNALSQSGQLDKARDLISANSAQFAALTNGTSAEQIAMRNKVAQTFGASGDFTLQEYAKHLGMKGEHASSFEDWANSTSTAKGESLAASINEKGIDRFDKDGLAFLASHMNALSGASASNIARVASTTTDNATIDKLSQVINKLDNVTKQNVLKATSAAQFVNMNDKIRIQIAAPADWKAQVGAAITADPQLKGKLTADEQTRYT